METVTIRGKKWVGTRVAQLGISFISELPGDLIGSTLSTKGPGKLQVIETPTTDILIELRCREGQQEVEKVLPEPKRHQGLCVFLEGENAEAVVYHRPLDVTKSIANIEQILEKEFAPQWLQSYEKNLSTAATNELIDRFPTKPKYLYVQTCSGTVTLRFDSQNSPSWTLAAKDLFEFPFEQLYLTWVAQSTKRLTFYVSNREIKRTTLA